MWTLLRHPNCYKKFFIFFFIQYKNEQLECEFWRQKYQKSKFYKNKKVFKIHEIYVSNTLVSDEEPCGSKN